MAQRTVIVTGAASGIGRATAARFARDGDRVVAADINGAGAEETARVICSAGGEAVGMVVDVADRVAVDDMVARTVERFGGLDVMVANAGTGVGKAFLDVSEEDLDRIIGVNLKGVFFCGQAAARVMIESGTGGTIVNTASTYAEVCAPSTAPYVATKGGVRMLTKAMALELGPHGIRVVAVAPGWIRTGMNPLADPERNKQLEAAIPLGRIGTPEDVAGVIRLLTSPDARYISGDMVFVDGGWIVQ